MRVEDSPASRHESGYAFLSNEVFLTFASEVLSTREPWLGVLTRQRQVERPVSSIAALPSRLAGVEDIGEPDYQDESMVQYLRAERVIAPWQSKGIKVVEMVRIYATGTPPRR